MASTCDYRMAIAPPDGRALWLLHDGVLLHLLASTSLMPAKLTLTLDDCFDARILRVDARNRRIFLRPYDKENAFELLKSSIEECSLVKATSTAVKMSSVYICRSDEELFRGVVTKVLEPEQQFMVYDIDSGHEYVAEADDIFELNPVIRDVPPLCLCTVLASCSHLGSCTEFDGFEAGQHCVCSLDKIYPSGYPRRVKELYPPAIVAHLFLKGQTYGSYTGAFTEVLCSLQPDPEESPISCLPKGTKNDICERSSPSSKYFSNRRSFSRNRHLPHLVVENATAYSLDGLTSSSFQFPKYRVHLPFTVNVFITRKTAYDTYIMRDTYIITKVQAHIKNPSNLLSSEAYFSKDAACIVRLVRRRNGKPRLYRAIASQFCPRRQTCVVYLVDYGQSLVCECDQIFDLEDQPPVILETPVAAFKCRVRRIAWRAKGLKVNKLGIEQGYRVCLTLKCGSKAYWGIVLPQSPMNFDAPNESQKGPQKVMDFERKEDGFEMYPMPSGLPEDETSVSSVEGSEDLDVLEQLNVLRANMESKKRHESMTMLSRMLQQLSERVDAMEVMAEYGRWNMCNPALVSACGYSQSSYEAGNVTPGEYGSGRMPCSSAVQFDPNVPPPNVAVLNQNLLHQFHQISVNQHRDSNCSNDISCSPTGEVRQIQTDVTGDDAYRSSPFQVVDTPREQYGRNAWDGIGKRNFSSSSEGFADLSARRRSVLDSPASFRDGKTDPESPFRGLDCNENPVSKLPIPGRYSYASALKKGLRGRKNGSVVYISSNEKKRKAHKAAF